MCSLEINGSPVIVGIEEIAAYLRRSTKIVHRMIRYGDLPAWFESKSYMTTKDKVDGWLRWQAEKDAEHRRSAGKTSDSPKKSDEDEGSDNAKDEEQFWLQKMQCSKISVFTADPPLLSIQEILDKSFPVRTISGIYFLIKDRKIVYVGQSIDVAHRISVHRAESRSENGKDFDEVAYVECNQDKMDALELAYIKGLKPKYNWQSEYL